MALTIITFFVDNLFLFWLPELLQWIRPLHYCLCPMLPFFRHDSHLLSPTPPGCWAQGRGSMGHHQGEGSSAEKSSWVLSRTHDGRVVRNPGVVVCSARGFALPAGEGGGGGGGRRSSVLYHFCFPLFCSPIFCLFFTVPFMCFPSLQKSLALFKIDFEQLPRLYPEREKNARTPSSYRVIKSFHSPSRVHQKPGLLKKSSE